MENSAGPSRFDADYIIISDAPDVDKTKPLKVPDETPPPSVIVLDEEDTTRSRGADSPASSTTSSSPVPEVWLGDTEEEEEEEFKTCPVCEMSNIPAAIINAHVSLCLEAEEQYRVID